MKKDKKGIVVNDQKFNLELLKEQLQPLNIYRERDLIITKYSDKTIASSCRSEKYGLLDFRDLVQGNLEQIEQVIQPVKYDLNINYGVQELKLFSDKFEVDGEYFQRMFILFSSSNGSYPMRLDVGLFRQVCSNGLMINTGQGYETNTKHYVLAIQKKVQMLKKMLPDFNQTIEDQLIFLRELKNGEISLQKIYLDLLKSRDKEPSKIATERVVKFGNKLLSSQSDAIQSFLDERETRSLSHPLELVANTNGTKDILIPKIKAYNCYTEIFNRRLHAVNAKENQRISEILLES